MFRGNIFYGIAWPGKVRELLHAAILCCFSFRKYMQQDGYCDMLLLTVHVAINEASVLASLIILNACDNDGQQSLLRFSDKLKRSFYCNHLLSLSLSLLMQLSMFSVFSPQSHQIQLISDLRLGRS